MEQILMTAVKRMALVDLGTALLEVQIMSGKSICDIFGMICGPAATRATILKQLDGCVILLKLVKHTHIDTHLSIHSNGYYLTL